MTEQRARQIERIYRGNNVAQLRSAIGFVAQWPESAAAADHVAVLEKMIAAKEVSR